MSSIGRSRITGGRSSDRNRLVLKLDRIFSKYIRLRDMLPETTMFRCISCGQVKPISEADCGHYINRKHMMTRFSEMNCNAQCKSCNRFDEGNSTGYRLGLIRKYGERQVLYLESLRTEHRRYEPFELEALCDHYNKKIAEELKKRGLRISCLTK